jgi:hypothetical protein
VPGSVLITGHTDNQPIRSLRFPSNWHLSQARAESVRDLLAPTVKPERMKAEGRAESQPLDDNKPRRRTRAQPARRDHPVRVEQLKPTVHEERTALVAEPGRDRHAGPVVPERAGLVGLPAGGLRQRRIRSTASGHA